MVVTMKIKLLTSNDQERNLNKTMISYRKACNYVSAYIYETRNLVQRKLHDELYYKIREEFGLKSQMANSVIRTVIASYKTILKKDNKWIKPSYEKLQYNLVWNRDYSIPGKEISVNTLDGRIKMMFENKGMEQYFNSEIYQFGTARLIHKNGIYYMYVSVKFDTEDVKISQIVNVVGVDQGINFIMTMYDSEHKTKFISGKELKQKRLHYLKLRRQLQKKHTASARQRLKKIGQRENRWIQDVNHQITKALVKQYPKNTLFVVEDLKGISGKLNNIRDKKQKSIHSSWSYDDIMKKLEYKAKRENSAVVKVNPYCTSQMCPRCGHIESKNRNKKLHLFECQRCGYRSNDDRVAAINLYYMGIHYIREKQMSDSVVVE